MAVQGWSERKTLSGSQFFARWLWRGFAMPLIAVFVVALLSLAYFSWEFCEICYQFHFEFSAIELSVFSIAGIVLGLVPTYQGIWHSKRMRENNGGRSVGLLAWVTGSLVIVPIFLVYFVLDLISAPHPT
ncbi:MAG: hypothetical protein CME01_13175 [Geminicoccus sp.]|nr:hypothetical protein [Geminicoccus sp.]